MQIAVLLTGNELMTGDTVDSNSSMMARYLNPLGFDIDRKVTVGDDTDVLVNQLKQLSQEYEVVLVNGGLGPTKDDLTAAALAKLSGHDLVLHSQAETHLRSWCAERGIQLNQVNLKQAWLPDEASIIANPIGSAVGIDLQYENCRFLSTPGVPSELELMLREEIAPLLSECFPQAQSKLIRRLRVFGIGESTLQQRIDEEIVEWPDSVALGFRVCMPLVELKLEISHAADIEDRDYCEAQILNVLGDSIIGDNDDRLVDVVVSELQRRAQTLATAESCTGGGIAAQITSIPGASAVFEAGFVTYSNAMKTSMLGVSTDSLEEHGAVSEPIVRAMALGALATSQADYAIAVSGIAGPGGGTEEKPVGTVWIAWGSASDLRAEKFIFPRSRKLFQEVIATMSLDLLRRHLLGLDQSPQYFQRV